MLGGGGLEMQSTSAVRRKYLGDVRTRQGRATVADITISHSPSPHHDRAKVEHALGQGSS
jgi:hypothetical protein